jgi:nitric oxide reductase activation protein
MEKHFSGSFERFKNILPKLKISSTDQVTFIVEPPKGFEGIIPPIKIPMKKQWEEDAGSEPYKPEDISNSPIWFRRKLLNILKDNVIQRPAGNKRDGDLDTKHLYKAFTTGRAFMKKDILSKKEYNVALCIDCSGSMKGERVKLVTKCAKTFITEFQEITNLMVISFNAITTILKPFHIKMKEKDFSKMGSSLFNSTEYNNKGAYGNHDHYAIKTARDNLLGIRRPHQRNIIVVMSDGRPQCQSDRDRKSVV